MKIIVLRFPYANPFFCEKSCEMIDLLKCDFQGFVSFDLNEKLTSYKGYPIYPLKDIGKLSWDLAIYGCEDRDFKDILPRMVELGIGRKEQFKNLHWFLQQFMIKKYEDSLDPIIQDTLEYWKTHDISVYNQHVKEGTSYKVFFDEDLPYINFKTVSGKTHKMYFPKSEFSQPNDDNYISNLLTEQQPTSPHLYIKGTHKINAGDIVIDAGVSQGNFALRYIDLCSKMYLFEPAEDWQEPLHRTFKDFGDKVEIIPKFVSNITDGENITIDDALPDLRGENIFLKMDVEGAEPLALQGAKRILTNNKVRASVCTYHFAEDLVKVKSIFQDYGFKTSTSAGYMVFLWDPNIWNTADFRKGIVYAEN